MLYTYQGLDVLMHISNNADQQLALQASALCFCEWIWTDWKNAAISLSLSLLLYCCYQYCYIIMIWRVVGAGHFECTDSNSVFTRFSQKEMEKTFNFF